jgi:RNA recognition motif-containing protein
MAGKEDSRIFVGGLSFHTDERKLSDAFRRFGKVVDAQVTNPLRVAPYHLLHMLLLLVCRRSR